MKSTIITTLALAALAFAPVSGAPKKESAKTSSKAKASAPAKVEEKESKLSREQEDARELVSELTTTQKTKMLSLLNEGETEELLVIKGISTTRAAAIDKARPFESIDEVVNVRGIGKSTFGEIISHARSLTARSKKTTTKKS